MTTAEVLAARVAEDGRVQCQACGERVFPDKPSRVWWLVTFASWVFLFAVGPFMMIFPLSVAGIPFFLMMALPVVSFTSDKLYRPATCPACGRYME
jgi:hypothetical protein